MIKIAHPVICSICRSSFDRDKIAFVQSGARRYAHATCMQQKYAELNKAIDFEIIDPESKVLCKYCKKVINKNNREEYIQITET